MRSGEDGYIRHRRMWDLAWRMLTHEARTRTVSKWTGLSERRVRSLAQRYSTPSSAGKGRPRGKSPYKIEALLRPPSLRIEASMFAHICANKGSMEGPNQQKDLALPDVTRGEALCTIFELFKSEFPSSSLTIEQALLIVSALLRGDELKLTECPRCSAPLLIDRLAGAQHRCALCLTKV